MQSPAYLIHAFAKSIRPKEKKREDGALIKVFLKNSGMSFSESFPNNAQVKLFGLAQVLQHFCGATSFW